MNPAKTRNTGRWTQTHYSPYYEFEQRSDDGSVLARMVITLGGERVPKGYKFTGPFSEDLAAAHRDGIVEWVWEVYLINTSKELITVTPKSVMGSPSSNASLKFFLGNGRSRPLSSTSTATTASSPRAFGIRIRRKVV
ncbi:MAG: hypothetical protein IPF61_15000 [Xanthomonadales bacterium]|nr:hypothetical protein [Xanthomonadales bacterium]